MRAVRSVIASNGVPCLQIRPLRSHSTSGREKEVKEETKGERRKDNKQYVFKNVLALSSEFSRMKSN